MYLSLLLHWGFLYQNLYEDHQFYRSLTDLCSMSLIHLFSFISLHNIRWRTEFHSFVVWQELCLSLNLLSDSVDCTLLPSVRRGLSIALSKRPKAVLSYQHQKLGTLLLSLCDWRCLFSLHYLAFVKHWINSVCKSIHCAAVGCGTDFCLGFQHNLHPRYHENKINIFLPCITMVLLDRGKLCCVISDGWVRKKPFNLS